MIVAPNGVHGLAPYGASGLKLKLYDEGLSPEESLAPYGTSGLETFGGFLKESFEMSNFAWDSWID